MTNELAKIESFRMELALVETIEEIKLINNAAEAFAAFAKKEKISIEGQNEIGRFRIEIIEKLGQWLNEHFPQGGERGNQYTGGKVTQGNLANMPATKRESVCSRTIAETLPEVKNKIFEFFESEGKIITPQSIYNEIKRPHVLNNSGENEWYTPKYIIESARNIMGSIDIDPASSLIANKIVNSKIFYTKEDDGLIQKWYGNVWLNPPYSQPLISKFSEAILQKRNEYNQACILVNNATETEWLQRIINISNGICFFKGRIKFIDFNGNPSGSPLQGQVIIYIGNNKEFFFKEFLKYGICMNVVQ